MTSDLKAYPRGARSLLAPCIFMFFALLQVEPVTAQSEPTGNWIVRLNPELASDEARATLEGLSVEILNPVGSLPNTWRVRPDGDTAEILLERWNVNALNAMQRRPDRLRALRAKEEGLDFPILWTEREVSAPAGVASAPSPNFTDGLYLEQWHLNNTGQSGGINGEDANLVPAWLRGYRGTGVVIGILDEGVESNHPDLSQNYRANLSFDYIGNDTFPTPESSGETHGVAVAGVAAARDNNVGGVGAAPRAGIASLRILSDIDGGNLTTGDVADALSRQPQAIHIYNNSWGYGVSGAGFLNVTRTQVIQDALQNGVLAGRGGRGSIYVWSSGNAAATGDNANYDNMVNSMYTIAVGSIGDRGVWSSYSNFGAALNIVAPSNGNIAGITTSDRVGLNGADTGDYRDDFGGTSSAAPLVSGIIALMLEANPQLTWRDVQHILHSTAVRVDPDDEDWQVNAAGFHVNHRYGFGRIDAGAAVRLAETWNPVPSAQQRDSEVGSVAESIPDGAGEWVENTLSFNQDLRLEHVLVVPSISHNRWGDLEIELVSPSGIVSELLNPFIGNENPENNFWQFLTLRNWGENARGDWTLRVRDTVAGSAGNFNSWRLTFRGTLPPESPDTRPVPTDDRAVSLETTLDVAVLENDVATENGALQLISVYRPPQGDAYLLDANTLRVEAPADFRGLMPITYTVADGGNNVAFGTLNFINPRPDAIDDRTGALPGQSVFIFPLRNDINADEDPLTLVEVTQPSQGGTIELYGDTFMRYQAPPDFSGLDSFSYSLTDSTGEVDTAEISVVVPQSRDFGLEFSSDDSRVRVPSSDSLNLRNAFTLEAWIYPTGYGEAPTGYGRIFDKEGYLLFLNSQNNDFYPDNSLVFYLRQQGIDGTAVTSPANSIPLNQWTHVAASYDGQGNANITINGSPVLTSPPNDPGDLFPPLQGPLIDSSDYDLFLGETNDLGRAFSGRIDEARIWNRVRSISEIQENYNRPLVGTPGGLVGYWPMVGGRGATVYDFSGNSNEGTLVDAIWSEGRIPGLARGEAWDTALDLGGGWRLSDWFGLFYEGAEPWIFHRSHGWLFQIADTDESILFYDPAFKDWLWTGRSAFPYFYKSRAGAWTFFQALSRDPRWFYNFETAEWEAK